jgi:hypothetical protein
VTYPLLFFLDSEPFWIGEDAVFTHKAESLPIETDIVKHITLDIGGGHLHECQIDLMHQAGGRPKLRMSASLLHSGTALAKVQDWAQI